MKILNKYKLAIIIFIGLLLRVLFVGSNPPGLTSDEAALGYNAYSILKTGRDEYGALFPIIFKSFGDYKPGLYVYLTVPSIAIFGLTEFATRLPSVLMGVAAIYLLYEIVKRVLENEKISFLSAFILSISPWHIQFSRGAWEANAALTLTLFGVLFFLKSFKNNKYLIASSVSFALTLLAYQGAKMSSAIILLLLVAYYRKPFFKIEKKILIISFVVGLFISIPIILSLFNGMTGRLTVFSVFSYRRPEDYLYPFLNQGSEYIGSVKYYLFHSEVLNFTRGILGRYFNHFSSDFLFFVGDWQNPRHTPPYHGVLLISDVILVVGSLFSLIKTKKSNVNFFLIWLLLAPLPSALSRDQVSAIRALQMLIPFSVILAIGLDYLTRFKKIFVLFVPIYLMAFIYYLDALFIHVPNHDAELWHYEYKQMVQTVTPIQNNYETVRVQQSYAQPYIYFLFYQKYDPVKYQQQAKLIDSEVEQDVGKVEHLDNLYFGPIDWSVNRGDTDTLFVADEVRMPIADSSDPEYFRLIKEIKYPNGFTAFRIVDVIK